MTKLRISEQLSLPLDWMTLATVVYGARGSGKTLYAVVIWFAIAVRRPSCWRRRVGLWLSLRIHALRDRLGQLEDLIDDVLVRA